MRAKVWFDKFGSKRAGGLGNDRIILNALKRHNVTDSVSELIWFTGLSIVKLEKFRLEGDK